MDFGGLGFCDAAGRGTVWVKWKGFRTSWALLFGSLSQAHGVPRWTRPEVPTRVRMVRHGSKQDVDVGWARHDGVAGPMLAVPGTTRWRRTGKRVQPRVPWPHCWRFSVARFHKKCFLEGRPCGRCGQVLRKASALCGLTCAATQRTGPGLYNLCSEDSDEPAHAADVMGATVQLKADLEGRGGPTDPNMSLFDSLNVDVLLPGESMEGLFAEGLAKPKVGGAAHLQIGRRGPDRQSGAVVPHARDLGPQETPGRSALKGIRLEESRRRKRARHSAGRGNGERHRTRGAKQSGRSPGT